MKKLLIIALGLFCAGALTVNAAEGEKRELTEDQKKLQKELLDKYDTNKDGKLDKEEKGKMSAEDKEKLAKAGLGGRKKQNQ